MVNRLVGLVLIMSVATFAGCAVSQEDYSGSAVTPLEEETFVFQTKDIQMQYTSVDKEIKKALDSLLAGRINKHEVNGMFINSRKTLDKLIENIKAVEAPGQLFAVKDALNFSLVYYRQGIEELQHYLDTDDPNIVNQAEELFEEADSFFKSFQEQMTPLTTQN